MGPLVKRLVLPEAKLLADAQALAKQGDLEGAMGLYEELIAGYPATEEAHLGLQLYVRVLIKSGQFHSKATYFKAMSNSPSHPLRDLARIFWIDASLENGEYPVVANYFQAQIDHNKGTVIEEDAYLQLGLLYLSYANDKDAARQEYNNLEAKFPNSEFLPLLASFIDLHEPGGSRAKRIQAMVAAAAAVAEVIPEQFALHSAYPNPFNPSTTLRYDLPTGSNVTLTVHDVLGREVAILADGFTAAGSHQTIWYGRNQRGTGVPSGVYIARLVTPEFTQSTKMVFLK